MSQEGRSRKTARNQGAQYMSGAQMIMAALNEHNVAHIFGYRGKAASPLFDALTVQNEMTHTAARTTPGAINAAEGYARASGKVGCVMMTSSSDVSSMRTALADAAADSAPLIVITELGSIDKINAKRTHTVRNTRELPRILHEAFIIARSGKPGPILISVPEMIQKKMGRYQTARECAGEEIAGREPIRPALSDIGKVMSMIRHAKRPILFTGAGVCHAGPEASELLHTFAKETGIPVTSTLKGLGAFPASDWQWLGMAGTFGTVEANKAMHGTDLIINIGAGFDDHVTGRLDRFAPHAKIIHFDIDGSSLGERVRPDLGIVADAKDALEAMHYAWQELGPIYSEEKSKIWWKVIEGWRKEKGLDFEAFKHTIRPQQAMLSLNNVLMRADAHITTDIGQHQMWAAQYLGFNKPNHFVTPGGLRSAGYGLSAAIGAQRAHPDELVVCISGDTSAQKVSQEMQTAAEAGLPIKLMIINNGGEGMVRQLGGLNHRKHSGGRETPSQPDFLELADAYGWKGLSCSSPQNLDSAIGEMLRSEGPCLLDCRVKSNENCYPMIPNGNAHNKMQRIPAKGLQAKPGA